MKRIGFIFTALSIVIISFSFLSCSKKKETPKEDNHIYIVASRGYFSEFSVLLDSAFGRIIYTPQPEKVFEVKRTEISELDKIKQKRNIVFLTTLDSRDEVSAYVNELLNSDQKQRIRDENGFIFYKRDLWADGQVIMILISKDKEALRRNIQNNQLRLLEEFHRVSNQLLSSRLYDSEFEQKDIQAHLLKDYGWMIYVQKNFKVVIDSPADQLVSLRDSSMPGVIKWIFVHWKDNASPAFLALDSITAERNRITQKYQKASDRKTFPTVSINYKTTNEINFKGNYALVTQGLWEMSDKSRGGPFINYTIYDEKTRRIYMLDGAIYAPGYYKRGLIQILDITLHSFMPAHLVPQEKKDVLLGKR